MKTHLLACFLPCFLPENYIPSPPEVRPAERRIRLGHVEIRNHDADLAQRNILSVNLSQAGSRERQGRLVPHRQQDAQVVHPYFHALAVVHALPDATSLELAADSDVPGCETVMCCGVMMMKLDVMLVRSEAVSWECVVDILQIYY